MPTELYQPEKSNEKGTRGMMKKQVNQNFILTLTLVALLLLVIISGVVLAEAVNSKMDGIQSEIESAQDQDEIGDVEGYGIIANGVGYVFGVIGIIAIVAYLIIIPAILALYIFIFALIARLIYKETSGRILAYRILMGFSFSGQIIMLLCCFLSLRSIGWGSLIGLVIGTYIFWVLLMGMRGTYTNRIISNGNAL